MGVVVENVGDPAVGFKPTQNLHQHPGVLARIIFAIIARSSDGVVLRVHGSNVNLILLSLSGTKLGKCCPSEDNAWIV